VHERPPTIDEFREIIYAHAREHRRALPWRGTTDPYRILVSEVMLQQTQAGRVAAKYEEFLAAFPDIGALAAASVGDILRVWQGMGYSRRAVALKRAAQRIVAEFGGEVPASVEALRTLPGIGPYTAGAIATFAYDRPIAFIETNIRRVFIHFFFPGRDDVRDREILPLVERTLDRADLRGWYHALMDYGVMLKRSGRDANRRSAHHRPQGPFTGSNRQLRGQIVRALTARPGTTQELAASLGREPERLEATLARLEADGLVRFDGERWGIA